MPFPLIPVVAAGASALGGLFNSFGQARQNRLSREFAVDMYKRQRADALHFWNLQNTYDSPQEQMRRFEAAGLNKNLIYSQGNPGNASQIQTPDVKMPEFRNPEFGNAVGGSLSSLSQIYDMDIKNAQVDNLKAQNTVLFQEALLKSVQASATAAAGERTEFDLDLAKELRTVSADAARESLRQLKTNIDLSTRKDAREAIQSSTSVSEALSRMQNMYEQRMTARLQRTHTEQDIKRIRLEMSRTKEQINNLRKEGIVKNLDVELSKRNMTPSDPLVFRWLQGLLNDWFE